MLARRRQFACLQEQIAQVHVRHGLIGMLANGFGVGAARRRPVTGEVQQCAQIVQRAHVRRRARQHVQIGLPGFLDLSHFMEQAGALKTQCDGFGV